MLFAVLLVDVDGVGIVVSDFGFGTVGGCFVLVLIIVLILALCVGTAGVVAFG